MKRKLCLPFYYFNSIGANESIVLYYFLQEMSSYETNISSVSLNKSELSEKSDIRFLKTDDISSVIENLFSLGFIFFHKKGGKKTRRFSICAMNVILFELFGVDNYKSFLREYENSKYIGKIIPFEDIKEEFIFEAPESSALDFLPYMRYVNMLSEKSEEDFKKDIVSDIRAVYSFDIKKIKKHIIEGKFVPSKDGDSCPQNIESFFVWGKMNSFSIKDVFCYDIVGHGGELEYVEFEEDSNSESAEEEKISLKDIARNDLMKYYEYMKISRTMKKPVLQWNATDFLSYLYCGMAKIGENEKNFKFPDFARECFQIKRLAEKYGNLRLYKIIYYSVKMREEIIEYFRLKDLRICMSTLSTDWIVEKILSFIEMKESEKFNSELSKVIIQGKEKREEQVKEQSSTELSDTKLDELRNSFNKDKKEK